MGKLIKNFSSVNAYFVEKLCTFAKVDLLIQI